MSVNLHCKELELIQTPTHITYMCYFADLEKQKPSPWKTIREKYEMYCTSIANESQDWSWHDRHTKLLRSFKILHFYIA